MSLAALVLAALPASAAARDDTVTEAVINMRLGQNAALLVEENLTFDYDGGFEASYRDIPLRPTDQIDNVVVSEGGRVYRPGGCTTFGCTDAEGTYGVTPEGNGIRIVWHHKASDESRTFTIRYRVIGAVIAYDDVLDLEWKVWGDQWEDKLDRLEATFTDPSLEPGDTSAQKPSGVWGHPRDVEGEVFLEPGVARLEADDVLAGQFVEMRVVLPREPGQNVSAARVESGDGLPGILAEEGDNDDDYNSPLNKLKRFIAEQRRAPRPDPRGGGPGDPLRVCPQGSRARPAARYRSTSPNRPTTPPPPSPTA